MNFAMLLAAEKTDQPTVDESLDSRDGNAGCGVHWLRSLQYNKGKATKGL